MIIQYALIGLMSGVLLYFLSNRNSMRVRAWKRIALVALIAVGIIAVLSPESTNQVAHVLGIGRGADLLLYLTVVAFVFVSLNVYLKFRDLEHDLAQIARSVAILDAEMRLHAVQSPDDEAREAR
jgi:hypothetical protein